MLAVKSSRPEDYVSHLQVPHGHEGQIDVPHGCVLHADLEPLYRVGFFSPPAFAYRFAYGNTLNEVLVHTNHHGEQAMTEDHISTDQPINSVMLNTERLIRIKNRENHARRLLACMGYALAKSRARRREDPTFGLYHIYDPATNTVVDGYGANGFEMTLDEVEEKAREIASCRGKAA